MVEYVKYHKTMHLPWSPGLQNDDRVITTLDHFKDKEVIVTEKMDGENASLYHSGYMHPRSIDGRYHPSRDWVKGWWASRAHMLDENFRICGENMFAQHSIIYNELESYFYGFSLWQHNWCLSWDATISKFQALDIIPVPEIWRGQFNIDILKEIGESLNPDTQEGYVVRLVNGYALEQSHLKIAKFVRQNHVQTDEFWMHSELKPNKLKGTPQ